MRANEFIFEDTDWGNVTSTADRSPMEAYTDNIADKIRAHCQPFLQANSDALQNHQFLFRGVKGATSLVIQGDVRNDRTPRDTPLVWHKALDQFFVNQFNWPYRSAALFATSNINNAYDYGKPYAIFPIGEFKICYSPIVEDITMDLAGGENAISTGISSKIQSVIKSIPANEIKNAARTYNMSMNDWTDFFLALMDFNANRPHTASGPGYEDNFPTMLTEFLLPRLGYTETRHLSDTGQSEVMIHCNSYYGIRNSFDYAELLSITERIFA